MSKQTIDVSQLSGWSNLSEGTQAVTVKTIVNGVENSASSNVVTVEKTLTKQTKEVSLLMVEGDQTILPDANMTMEKAIVKKPATLIPSNIKQGVSIGGVVGELTTTGKEEVEVSEELNMANGNLVISPPDNTKTLSQVTIIKPDTFIPENIKKDVNIGGIIGTLEMGGIDTSDATATSRDILQDKTAYAKGVKITGAIKTYDGSYNVVIPAGTVFTLKNVLTHPNQGFLIIPVGVNTGTNAVYFSAILPNGNLAYIDSIDVAYALSGTLSFNGYTVSLSNDVYTWLNYTDSNGQTYAPNTWIHPEAKIFSVPSHMSLSISSKGFEWLKQNCETIEWGSMV